MPGSPNHSATPEQGVGRLDLGSHVLAFEVAGSGPETLVLCDGPGSSRGTWRAIVERLAPDFRIVAFDERGHGESTAPADAGRWTPDDLSADLGAMIDHVGTGRVHLVGHSDGGLVAARFAARHPERIDRLILPCAACSDARLASDLRTANRPTLVLAGATDLTGPGVRAIIEAIPQTRLHVVDDAGLEAPDRLARIVRAFLSADDPARLAGICRAFQGAPFYQTLGVEVASTRAGTARLRLPFVDRLTSRYGGIHGGALMVLADAAINVALVTTFLEDERTKTVDIAIQFWAPAGQNEVQAEATVRHQAGRLAFGDCWLFAAGRPIAKCQGTCRLSTPKAADTIDRKSGGGTAL